MNKFKKLDREEMKKISGGGEHTCHLDNFCWIENVYTGVLDPGQWCKIPDSGVGCRCYNPDWDFGGGSGYGDVNYCYSEPA